MECPRGSMCKESAHEVKTLEAAREWFPEVEEQDLPVIVEQQTARNGRVRIKVKRNDGRLIFSKG